MKLVLISDTHTKHDFIVPDGDVLIHAGDFTVNGTEEQIIEFSQWIDAFPHKTKLVVAGNHDRMFDLQPDKAKDLLSIHAPSVVYLEDDSINIEGIKFYGSPWTPEFHSDYWRFHYKRHSERAHKIWDSIPDDVEVLITHGPAFGQLDQVYGHNAGCEVLRERLNGLPKLKLHVFGHIHPAHGVIERNWIIANAAICDEAYRPTQAPIEVEL